MTFRCGIVKLAPSFNTSTFTMRQIPIIIDTDPGQDDAVAILTALGSPMLEVIGISVVAGNVPLERTQENARIICEWAGRHDIPVHAGCARPLLRPLVTAEHVHGKTGLDGVALHQPTLPLQSEHAVDFIVRTLRQRDSGSVTLCMLGPLTNLAMAIVKAPDIVARIKDIVLMGGAYFEGGNITPSAEFNIHVDPDAAATVLGCGAPITMLPLDVTHKARGTPARINLLRALPNRAGNLAADILTTLERFDVQRYGVNGAPLHDPTVIAYVLQPALFSGKHVHVAVEQGSELTLGATPVDWWGVTGKAANVYYITEVDADGFFALLAENLSRLP